MKEKLYIKIILIAFLSIFFSVCTFENYKHEKNVIIKIEFPNNNKSTAKINLLNRPADAVPNYIPSFIDRIVITVQIEGQDEQIFETTSQAGDLSNEIDIDLDYDQTGTISVEAYTFNKRNTVDNQWILTHYGSMNIEDIELSSTQIETSMTMEVNSGTVLDDEPINVDLSDLEYRSGVIIHTSAISSDGKIGIAWIKASSREIYISTYGSHGEISSDRVKYVDKETFPLGAFSSAYRGNTFYLPWKLFGTRDLFFFTYNEEQDIPVSGEILIKQNMISASNNYLFKMTDQYALLAMTYPSGEVSYMLYGESLAQPLFGSDPVNLCGPTPGCINPVVAILENRKFLVASTISPTYEILVRTFDKDDMNNYSEINLGLIGDMHTVASILKGSFNMITRPSTSQFSISFLGDDVEAFSPVHNDVWPSGPVNSLKEKPSLQNIRDDFQVLFWMDDRDGYLSPYFSILDENGAAVEDRKLQELTANGYSHEVAANDDGLVSVSWMTSTYNIFFKRILF